MKKITIEYENGPTVRLTRSAEPGMHRVEVLIGYSDAGKLWQRYAVPEDKCRFGLGLAATAVRRWKDDQKREAKKLINRLVEA